ncbi:MAG: type II secretion system F family protein [Eubacteriales bacterium]|nr:type II secretion system F family protein [Eubacteriales bacterium]
MQKYSYTAVNINNKKLKGIYIAEDEKDLRIQLAKQKLYLIKAQKAPDKTKASFFSVSGRVKPNERNTFCRQLAIMINSGVSIVNSIGILKQQHYTAFFKRILDSVYEDIKAGVLLSDAMAKYPKVFPAFFTGMTSVGEKSGMLDEVLRTVSDYYETDARIKKKARSAMVYPIILLVLMVGILVLMVAFVIPAFEKSLASLEVEMPVITVKIMGLSRFVRGYWKEIMLSLAVVFGGLTLAVKTKKGRYIWHTILLDMPVFGKVQQALISARFARSFGLLLESGMDLTDAMKSVTAVLGNKNTEKRFTAAAEEVKQGESLTTALDKYKLFPQMLIQMISVGEKTGSIGQVLLRSCGYFDEHVENSLSAMSQFIQPVMLVVMGGLLGLMFYAIYAPMISIMTTLE